MSLIQGAVIFTKISTRTSFRPRSLSQLGGFVFGAKALTRSMNSSAFAWVKRSCVTGIDSDSARTVNFDIPFTKADSILKFTGQLVDSHFIFSEASIENELSLLYSFFLINFIF